jgi:transcriptional regulator with XRE-family HTH domain
LGKLIKKTREDKEMSLIYVAAKMDINPSDLISVESGDKLPGPSYFLELCDLLELNYHKAWQLFIEEKMGAFEYRIRREYWQLYNKSIEGN